MKNEITAKISRAREYSAERVELGVIIGDPGEDGAGGRVVDVSVTGPEERFGSLYPATVNWPAIGSVEAEYAEDFARLLQEAAHLARHLDAGGSATELYPEARVF